MRLMVLLFMRSGWWRIWSFKETEVGEMFARRCAQKHMRSLVKNIWINARGFTVVDTKLILTSRCMCFWARPPHLNFVINFLKFIFYWFSLRNKFSRWRNCFILALSLHSCTPNKFPESSTKSASSSDQKKK